MYNVDENMQTIVESFTTRSLKDGPTWFCVPCAPALFKSRIFKKIVLDSTQYVEVRDWKSNEVTIIAGPAKVQLKSPYDRISSVMQKASVPMHHYLRVVNQDGRVEHIEGPILYTPKAYQTCDVPRPVPALQVNQYAWLMNMRDHTYRRIVGPKTFIPDPFEMYVAFDNNGQPMPCDALTVLPAFEVNKMQSLHVRCTSSGVIRMISEPQRYMPALDEVVTKVVSITTLEVNEFCIVLDSVSGERSIKRYDDPATRAFFLGPFDKLLEFQIPETQQTRNIVKATRLNLRNNRFSISFTYRSSDNVLIDISCAIAYDIVDLARFANIGDVYVTTMRDWLRDRLSRRVATEEHRKVFSIVPQLLQEITEDAPSFFLEKGITITSLQLNEVKCANPEIQRVLDAYVKETTDRVSNMMREKAESEVAVERIQRDIRVETENRKLVELRRENLVKEAQAQAEAAAAQQRKIFEAIKEFAGGKAPEVYAAMAEVEKAKALSDKIQTAFLTPEQMMLKMKMPSANGKSD